MLLFHLLHMNDIHLLFGGGYDIKLDKKETSYMANSNPSSYNFGANINALYGNIYPNRFTPKRWFVYQMG